jgi:cytidylate kinase
MDARRAEPSEMVMPIGAFIDTILRAPRPPDMRTKIVAIDGCGGAGKSTLAARIAPRLVDAPVIHTDDFASFLTARYMETDRPVSRADVVVSGEPTIDHDPENEIVVIVDSTQVRST